jgi:hypothetical protein
MKTYKVWAREIGSSFSYCTYEFKAKNMREAKEKCKQWDCNSKPYLVK